MFPIESGVIDSRHNSFDSQQILADNVPIFAAIERLLHGFFRPLVLPFVSRLASPKPTSAPRIAAPPRLVVGLSSTAVNRRNGRAHVDL
jgi:hypothetical protein